MQQLLQSSIYSHCSPARMLSMGPISWIFSDPNPCAADGLTRDD